MAFHRKYLPFSNQLSLVRTKAIWCTIHRILDLPAAELRTARLMAYRQKRKVSPIAMRSQRVWLCFWAPNPNHFVKFAFLALRWPKHRRIFHRCRRLSVPLIVSISLRMLSHHRNVPQNGIYPVECTDFDIISERRCHRTALDFPDIYK